MSSQKSLFQKPSEVEIKSASQLLKPWQWVTDPLFFGLEELPTSGPALFVSNHTLMGMLDIPILWEALYRRKGIFLRSLGDHFHFTVPVWRTLLSRFGTVDGTRKNCEKLMENGEFILVFPGGAGEVNKRKGQRYQLLWKERIGFAKMAIQHGCPIIPFAAVGAEDCYDIVLDRDDLFKTPVGKLLKRLKVREDGIPPLVKGLGPTILPKPQRFYFKFLSPIDTTRFQGAFENLDYCYELRNETKAKVEEGITFLLNYRQQQPPPRMSQRLLRRFNAK